MSAPWLLLGTVLGASVIGSLHCVGMCGGFVAAVSGARPQRADGRRELAPLFAYQGARGFAYLVLGALAGLLGASLEASAAWLGVQRLAGPLMGVSLIVMAIASLWPTRSAHSAHSASSSLIGIGAKTRDHNVIQRARLRLTKAVRERGASAGAAAGLLTALLPCGWLWAYVVLAASTGSVGHALLVMAAFWLGSVPALLGVGLLAGELGRRVGRHAPRITAAIMIVLGVLSLAGKLSPAPALDHAQPVTNSQVTDPQVVPATAPCH